MWRAISVLICGLIIGSRLFATSEIYFQLKVVILWSILVLEWHKARAHALVTFIWLPHYLKNRELLKVQCQIINLFFFSLPNINDMPNFIEPIFFRDNSEDSLNAFKIHLSGSLLAFNSSDNFDIDDIADTIQWLFHFSHWSAWRHHSSENGRCLTIHPKNPWYSRIS